MLKIRNFTLIYDEPVLENVNFNSKSSETVALTGTPRSRKSNLLRVIDDAIPYFQPAEPSGEVICQDENLLDLDMPEHSNIVATVFQGPKTQFYAVNSTDEMASALESRHLPSRAIFWRTNQFTQLLEMGDLLSHGVFASPGSEKQFPTITSAACMDNDTYLLDEPSPSLDRLTEKLLHASKESWLN